METRASLFLVSFQTPCLIVHVNVSLPFVLSCDFSAVLREARVVSPCSVFKGRPETQISCSVEQTGTFVLLLCPRGL